MWAGKTPRELEQVIEMTHRRVLGLAALLAGLAFALPANATTTPKDYKAPYDRGELCGGTGQGQPICFHSSGTKPDQAPAEPARNGFLTVGVGVSGFDHSAAEVVFTADSSSKVYNISADVIGSISNTPNLNLCLVAFVDQSTGIGSNCTTMLPDGTAHLAFSHTLPVGIPISIEVSLDSSRGVLGGPAWVRVSGFKVT